MGLDESTSQKLRMDVGRVLIIATSPEGIDKVDRKINS